MGGAHPLAAPQHASAAQVTSGTSGTSTASSSQPQTSLHQLVTIQQYLQQQQPLAQLWVKVLAVAAGPHGVLTWLLAWS